MAPGTGCTWTVYKLRWLLFDTAQTSLLFALEKKKRIQGPHINTKYRLHNEFFGRKIRSTCTRHYILAASFFATFVSLVKAFFHFAGLRTNTQNQSSYYNFDEDSTTTGE